MGANSSSYKLHQACPDQNAKYEHCYALFFENRIIPQPVVLPTDPNDPASVAAAAAASKRTVYREGVVVTDPADIALTNEILDKEHKNYACRDLWEDYKECVNEVFNQKQAAYLKRRAEKEAAKQAKQPASNEEPRR